jgi:hypothetical protein
MRGVVEEKRGLQGKLVPNKEEEISQGRGGNMLSMGVWTGNLLYT